MNTFNSNENKGMLWQLLYEQGAFNNINNDYINNIKRDFEKFINNINFKNELGLKDQNKLLLSEMINYLSKYKNNISLNNVVNKPLQEVQLKLDKDLKEKEKEFIQLIKKPSPEEIDFTEKIDEPMNESNVNLLLNKMIAEREIEIENIMPEKKNSTLNEMDSNIQSINNNLSLQKEELQKDLPNKLNKKLTNDFFKNLSNSKSVTFSEINDDEEESINKFELKETNNLKILLNKILDNQEKIMKKLDII